MVERGELTEEAWAALAPHLPVCGRRGSQWRDHRGVINGILWKLPTGAPWRDLPARYGHWQTCAGRLYRWRRDGDAPGLRSGHLARRNAVEHCINRLKQWRGLATRYEKRAANYRAMVVSAAIVVWLDA